MGKKEELMPPLASPIPGRWGRRAALVLGYTATAVMPGRVKQIKEGRAGERLSLTDRLIVAALAHRALIRNEPFDQFAYLHQYMWRDDDITAFHAHVEDRFTRWFLPHQSRVIDALVADLAHQPQGRFTTLCEIGCGSGVVLDHLRERLAASGITEVIGLDLSPAQIAANTRRFPGCRFVAGDATTWIPQNQRSGWIIFCCGGVLEYFPRVVLEALIASTATKPVRWVVVEPLAPAHEVGQDKTSLVFSAESTWSHPYPHLFRQAGLDVLYDHDLRFDGMRWQLAIAGN